MYCTVLYNFRLSGTWSGMKSETYNHISTRARVLRSFARLLRSAITPMRLDCVHRGLLDNLNAKLSNHSRKLKRKPFVVTKRSPE